VKTGPLGGVAVSFFFVLSGFILVYVYQGRLTRASTPKFYFTRFARIWPLHIACLLLMVWLLPIYLPASDMPWVRAFAHWSLLQSWYPAATWMHCYNGVAWTISTEAFFYAMFPLLLLGTPRQFWIKYACLFPLTFGGMIWMASVIEPVSPIRAIANASLDPTNIVQFFPPFRLLEFMTGMGAGMIFRSRSAKIAASTSARDWKVTAKTTALEALVLVFSLGSFQLLYACGLFRYLHTFGEVGQALIYWFSFSGGFLFHAAVIYVFARSTGWISRFFGSRAMVFLGEISFAFYMIHYSVIVFAKNEFWVGSNFSVGYFALLTLALSIGVSAWLYYLIEVPTKETLLKWYAGKSSPLDLVAQLLTKPAQRIGHPTVIYALVLAIVLPVVATKLYKRADRKSFSADQILASVSSEIQPVSFGKRAELLVAEVIPRRDAARVNTVWRFSSPGTALISVHFVGTEHPTERREIVCSQEMVGQPLVTNMIVDQGKYEAADAIEVSLSIDGTEIAHQKLQGNESEIDGQHYPIFSSEKIQEGLRVSRLPVLTR